MREAEISEAAVNIFTYYPCSYLTNSVFGHDKSREIKPYKALPEGKRPTLLYAGDGVSDLSAAAETDLLFARDGKGESKSR